MVDKVSEKTAENEQELKAVTESLYKQNLELAVKNKTLSLLRQLYQISIQTLEPKVLARKLGQTIREAFEFELVAFFSYSKEKDTLMPLQIASSKRWDEANSENQIDIEEISNASSHTLLREVILGGNMTHTEEMADIWRNYLPIEALKIFQGKTHVKSFLIYPLTIDDKVIGVLLIALNRHYDELIQFEKDSISSFVNVLAVALDRARLYLELQVTNKELAEANDKLRELDQLKSQFLSFASHQLRAPLSAIDGYASMLLEGDFGEMTDKVRNSVQIIDTSSKSLIKIVNEFLDVSRIEQGRMQYEFVDFDVKELVEEVVKELRPNVENKGLKFNFKANKNTDYITNGDMGKIKQVVGNLVDNSIKYTPEGSIDVEVKRVEKNILVTIADTGIGIEKDQIPKLFSMFTRAQDAQKTNVIGTGLGLYVAKQMVEAHKGRVWVESPGKGKGSTFYIELPAKN